MISGAHAIVYSKDADADRAFLRDVLGLQGVDVGGGWLIFGLPPSEVAVHPANENGHELFFLVDDVDWFVGAMRERKVKCSRVRVESWGRITDLTLPGGGTIGVYEPRHARPTAPRRAGGSKRVVAGGRTRPARR